MSNELETLDNTIVGTLASSIVRVVFENLDTVQRGLLGNTVCGATNGSSDVSSVAAGIAALASEGLDFLSTTAKVLNQVLDLNLIMTVCNVIYTYGVLVETSVNNVSTSTGTSAVVVDVAAGSSLLVGDACKTPGRLVLCNGSKGNRLGILFDVLDL